MYRLKESVSSCTVKNTIVQDHEPRPLEFWGDKLKWLLENGFIEVIEEEGKEEPKKEVKKNKKGA